MIRKLRTDELDDFVAEVEELGGPDSSQAIAAFPAIHLSYKTKVDVDLDPFSDRYVDQQIALHAEISGRSFDQSANEAGPSHDPKLLVAHNPSCSANIEYMAGTLRTVSSAMLIANLPDAPRILDLGCGVGFTSEFMAYCGGRVDAIDITPQNVDVINSRANRLGLNIRAKVGNFDSLALDAEYDFAIFYASLHHALRPWVVLETISRQLSPSGKIAIAGEPINSLWWPHWGLRLDLESLYMMRKYGWFESGFSEPFISACFKKVGLDLSFFHGVGFNKGTIGIGARPNIEPANALKPETIGASADDELQNLRAQVAKSEITLVETFGHLNRLKSSPWYKLSTKINEATRALSRRRKQ